MSYSPQPITSKGNRAIRKEMQSWWHYGRELEIGPGIKILGR